MVVVDAHCHVSEQWYEPVDTLLFEMDRNGVDQAALIQVRGQFDNSYQQACMRRYPDRFSSVVVVDVSSTDGVRDLERWAADGACGVRLGPTARSPGDDPLAIWRAAERLGLAVSCLGTGEDFAGEPFLQVAAEFPSLKIVVEHLAGTAASVFPRLAQQPNVFLKVTGLGEFAKRAMPVPRDPFPFERPIPPHLEQALAAFGAERLMWGSDFPPVASREGYGLALRLCREQYAGRSEAERELIFGGVAATVFPCG